MVSIYDWFGYQVPIEDRYKMIKDAGFDGVLLWWSDGFGRGTDYQEGVRYAHDAGLIVENMHAPVQEQDNLSLDNLDGDSLLRCYMQCIDDCKTYEIPTMVVHLPNDRFPINKLGMERIKIMTDRAEKSDINIAMENLFNTDNLACVLGEISSERIGYCYDACHYANNEKAGDLLSMYGKRLMALHLHDNGGSRAQHQLPFDGNLDWNKVMKDIASTGYKGATSLEPMNWDYENMTIQEFLQRAYDKVKKLERMRIA